MKKELLLDIGGEGGGIKYYRGYFDKFTVYFSSISEIDEELEFHTNISPFYHSFADLWYKQEVSEKGIFEATEPSYIHKEIEIDLQRFLKSAIVYNNVNKDFVREEWLCLIEK